MYVWRESAKIARKVRHWCLHCSWRRECWDLKVEEIHEIHRSLDFSIAVMASCCKWNNRTTAQGETWPKNGGQVKSSDLVLDLCAAPGAWDWQISCDFWWRRCHFSGATEFDVKLQRISQAARPWNALSSCGSTSCRHCTNIIEK